MLERRSLKLPITLGVAMIVSIVTLIVGWVLLTVFGARTQPDSTVYWTLLTVGTILLAMVLAGVVTYLTLSVKAINLNRRQSNFIDSVTHELKSPIASLKLYLQTMNRRELTDEEQVKFRKFMMDDVERLDQLITHMLDAGLTEKKQSTEDIEEFDLAEVITDCADTVCLRYRVERDVVSTDLAGCVIRASRRDVAMIFRNLIDNAVKYAGSPPSVNVSMEVIEQMAVVRIADNGPGIPAGLRRKVFGRFVRLGKELERKKPGTGLGLYIVRTLTRRLRGRVTVLDDSSSKGTVFEVRLPVTATSSQSPPRRNVGSNKPQQFTTESPVQDSDESPASDSRRKPDDVVTSGHDRSLTN